MRNIRIEMAYDGTNYHGFQTQKNGVTVQETIENALSEFLKEKITVTGCGRTDAGVHAMKYFFNFYTSSTVPADKIPYAMKPYLPCDIVFKKGEEVDEDFHSRFSVKKKTYVYKILNTPFCEPFYRNYAFFYPYELDIEKMRDACQILKGTHDFKAFMASGGQVKTTVRTIFDIKIEKDEKTGIISIYVSADGFLYNMVRIIAGTLIAVGNSKLFKKDIEEALKNCDRTMLGTTVPPQGLYMYDVLY